MASKYEGMGKTLARGIRGGILTSIVSALMVVPALAQDWALIRPHWIVETSVEACLIGIDGSLSGSLDDEVVQVDFDELTNYTNPGAAFRIQAQKGRWSILTDLQYVSVDLEGDVEYPPASGTQAKAENKMDQMIWELTGAYLFAANWDFTLSSRVFSYQDDYKVDGESVLNGTTTWVDFFLGLRFRSEVGQDWLISLRGDAGVGASSFAAYFDFRTRYKFGGGRLWTEGGIRANYADNESGESYFDDYRAYDATTLGLFLGLGYTF